MKTAALLVAALLAGFLLGSLRPRLELHRLRQELRDTTAKLEKKSSGTVPALSGLSQMLDLPEDLPPAQLRAQAPSEPASASLPPDDPATAAASPSPPQPTEQDDPGPTGFREGLETAADAWAVRSELARNSFVEQAGLDRDQSVRFDVIMEAMNLRIGSIIDRYALAAREGSMKVNEEFGIRMMNEVAGALVVTYDEMDRGLASGWRELAGTAFSITDMIDPHVALPLAEFEHELEMD